MELDLLALVALGLALEVEDAELVKRGAAARRVEAPAAVDEDLRKYFPLTHFTWPDVVDVSGGDDLEPVKVCSCSTPGRCKLCRGEVILM